MRYIRVEWRHDDQDEPVMLLSELDDESYETRKIELFRDGRGGFADASESLPPTQLGLVPVPELREIAIFPEFRPEEITKAEFERAWESARAAVRT